MKNIIKNTLNCLIIFCILSQHGNALALAPDSPFIEEAPEAVVDVEPAKEPAAVDVLKLDTDAWQDGIREGTINIDNTELLKILEHRVGRIQHNVSDITIQVEYSGGAVAAALRIIFFEDFNDFLSYVPYKVMDSDTIPHRVMDSDTIPLKFLVVTRERSPIILRDLLDRFGISYKQQTLKQEEDNLRKRLQTIINLINDAINSSPFIRMGEEYSPEIHGYFKKSFQKNTEDMVLLAELLEIDRTDYYAEPITPEHLKRDALASL